MKQLHVGMRSCVWGMACTYAAAAWWMQNAMHACMWALPQAKLAISHQQQQQLNRSRPRCCQHQPQYLVLGSGHLHGEDKDKDLVSAAKSHASWLLYLAMLRDHVTTVQYAAGEVVMEDSDCCVMLVVALRVCEPQDRQLRGHALGHRHNTPTMHALTRGLATT